MSKTKKPNVADMFYPENKEKLLFALSEFNALSAKNYLVESRAIIVPHAGYVFSGQLAADGFQYLKKDSKTIFVIAPSHHVAVDGVLVCDYDKFSTPLGDLNVDVDIVDELKEKFSSKVNNEAFEKEHSIEVQLPFIQFYFQNIKIVPLIVGYEGNSILKDIFEYYFKNENISFVISSDLSHFYNAVDAKKIDNTTANMIELLDYDDFHSQQACGASAILPLLAFAKSNSYSLIRINMKNSGDVSGDNERVVGYGSWLLYENTKSEFIAKYFSEKVIEICTKSISRGLNNKKLEKQDLTLIPPVLDELGASFVTLQTDGHLRGCIGSIIAHRSLIDDLIENAYSAAFRDTRFYPLTEDEFENLEISVSLLSAPQKMHFKDETDLLEQIQPFVDGIIIKDGMYQAVYLPSVWEQLPSKVDFLNSLKQKAGLRANHFTKTFEAYRFKSVHIE